MNSFVFLVLSQEEQSSSNEAAVPNEGELPSDQGDAQGNPVTMHCAPCESTIISENEGNVYPEAAIENLVEYPNEELAIAELAPQENKKSLKKKTSKSRRGLKSRKKGKQEKFQIELVKEIRRRNGRLEFLVKWAGYSEMLNSWEPEEHFRQEDIDAFTKEIEIQE